jgi:hypothetical protein
VFLLDFFGTFCIKAKSTKRKNGAVGHATLRLPLLVVARPLAL